VADLTPFLDPSVQLDNGYSVWTISVLTDGALQNATVTLPYQAAAPDGGWHVVANAHGTTGVGPNCVVAGTVAGAGLAGLFGGHGLIGVAPDYPGFATTSHPYLVKTSEGHAVLDALRAAAQLARWQQLAVSGRFAATGNSQGGHATLSAAIEHDAYAPELDLRGYAVAGPASAYEEQWAYGAQFDGPHLPYHALLMYAWARHYGFDGGTPFAPALAANIDTLMTQDCLYSALGAPDLAAAIGTDAGEIFDPVFLAEYRSGAWNHFAPFHLWFGENRVKPWVQHAPLKVYQGTADTTVPEWTTEQLVADLRDGGVTVDLELVPDAGHTEVAFGFIAYPQARTAESIAWLKQQLDR
jgi:dienelactone hydrolase